MGKRFTFADAKEKIKDLEHRLDTSDNIYSKKENEYIKRLEASKGKCSATCNTYKIVAAILLLTNIIQLFV